VLTKPEPCLSRSLPGLCKCSKVHVGATLPGVEIKIFREIAEHLGRDLAMPTSMSKNKFVVLRAFPQGKGISTFVLVEPTD